MTPIEKSIESATIEEIVKQELPHITVEKPTAYYRGSYTFDEQTIRKALQYIREKKLIEDAKELIEDFGNEPNRNSITYVVPDDKTFEVSWVQGPNVYIGFLNLTTQEGKEITNLRLYGMRTT